MGNSFKTRVKQLLNKGEEHYSTFEEKQRVRLLNITIYLGWLIILPYVLIQTIIGESYLETILLSATILALCPVFYLNRTGNNQVAAILFFILLNVQSIFAVLVVNIQIAAPYFDIVMGSAAVFFIRNKAFKIGIATFCFASFIFLNYYQLQKYPPDLPSYSVVVLMLICLYIIMSLFDTENLHYQKLLETKNIRLNQQNETIKSQTDQLIKLEKEYYEKELALKQKDFDQVLMNNRMQLKIRENMLSQLEKAISEKDNTKTIKSMIFELKAQIDTQNKLHFTEENIKALNANFFNRLNTDYPALTKKEIELCSYIKLGLATKEIAHLLSTTENTIYVTKNRLRSKLNLTNNDEVNRLIKNI